ncbi:UNKNOWN [Stylonychia lemnae]|uniref:Uncharacterized protein n=1 Tax=Stylonychia lemnae TaxID=5949 RepID=A0A078B700_STYLE|nr:UNKNOWN [Stylonychia lemnae]|eukprot:CDW90295.1 UNKNOWN [Stylonychia lemnae]
MANQSTKDNSIISGQSKKKIPTKYILSEYQSKKSENQLAYKSEQQKIEEQLKILTSYQINDHSQPLMSNIQDITNNDYDKLSQIESLSNSQPT